jgi:hypothetical protein
MVMVAGCESSPDPWTGDSQSLVPFRVDSALSIAPEIISPTGKPAYSLLYMIKEDKKGIETRFIGPSEALTAGLQFFSQFGCNGHELICEVAGSDYQIVLARWQTGPDGSIRDAAVRIEPVIEIRPLKLKPGQMVSDVEWRPYINGQGVGPWRR